MLCCVRDAWNIAKSVKNHVIYQTIFIMVNKWELFANSNSILRMAIVHLAKKIVINVPHKAFVFYVMMDFTIIKILIHVVFVVLNVKHVSILMNMKILGALLPRVILRNIYIGKWAFLKEDVINVDLCAGFVNLNSISLQSNISIDAWDVLTKKNNFFLLMELIVLKGISRIAYMAFSISKLIDN